MSEATNPTTTEEAEARALAEWAGLEYREAGAVAVDPRALSILRADECRRLRAVPLAATTGSAIIAVSDPNEDRLESVQQLTGPSTRFVVLTDRTLDALLRSRMFAGAPSAETTEPEPAEAPPDYEPDPVVEFEPSHEPEHEPDPVDEIRAEVPPVFGPAAAPAEHGVDGELVDAIVAALGPRLLSIASHGAAVRTPSEHVGDSIMDPVTRVDEAIEAMVEPTCSFGDDRRGARRLEAEPARGEGAALGPPRRERPAAGPHRRTRGRGRETQVARR
jgi:type II secretion system (T2SS) protein E